MLKEKIFSLTTISMACIVSYNSVYGRGMLCIMAGLRLDIFAGYSVSLGSVHLFYTSVMRPYKMVLASLLIVVIAEVWDLPFKG